MSSWTLSPFSREFRRIALPSGLGGPAGRRLFAPGDWIRLRAEYPGRYAADKEKWADFFIRLTETYLVPGLSSHIVVKDIATPAHRREASMSWRP